MGRRNSSVPADTDSEDQFAGESLSDAVERIENRVESLAGEVKSSLGHMTSELRGLDQAIYDLADRLQWVCNNLAGDQWRVVGPVASPAPVHRFEHAMDPIHLACRGCDCDPPPSLEHALRAGWSELMEDKTDEWDYLGLCPSCRASEEQPDPPVECHVCKAKGPATPAAALKAQWVVLSFNVPDGYIGVCPACEAKRVEDEVASMRRQTAEAVYCCASPKLEWNSAPEAPGIACENCGLVVAEAGDLILPFEQRDDPDDGDDGQSRAIATNADQSQQSLF